MRITLRVIPSHSLPALPTLAILYATNTLEKNRENQMRKQPLFEKLFSPKMRFPLHLSSYQLTTLPLSLHSSFLPLHLLSFAGKSNDIALKIKRPFTDIPAKPIHLNRPFHTQLFLFLPDLSRINPISHTKLSLLSPNELSPTHKRKGVDPVYSTPSRDALFFPVIARVQSCNNRENLHRNRQNSFRFPSLTFAPNPNISQQPLSPIYSTTSPPKHPFLFPFTLFTLLPYPLPPLEPSTAKYDPSNRISPPLHHAFPTMSGRGFVPTVATQHYTSSQKKKELNTYNQLLQSMLPFSSPTRYLVTWHIPQIPV